MRNYFIIDLFFQNFFFKKPFCKKGILKIRKISGKYHCHIPRKIQAFPPDFLVSKFSVNGQFRHQEIR